MDDKVPSDESESVAMISTFRTPAAAADKLLPTFFVRGFGVTTVLQLLYGALLHE